ncbi:MAG: class I SAM-dependent methyltransferase [Firmicutes bacterium]|nr:class I SAM-dependent methyltransferase [Bacillota bacterium]
MSYTDFAYLYDALIDEDYIKWTDYIEAVFLRYGKKPSLVLDLACGTGSITTLLAKRGYDMIGLDKSADMLAVAMQKKGSLPICYTNQDMTSFELYGTVDAIVCTLDSINYVLEAEKVKKLFRLVKNYLNPNGLFIFDVNSEYKFSKILGNNCFVTDTGKIFYTWENVYRPKSKICTYKLTFFVRNGEKYYRKDEIQKQRAYSQEQISQMLDEANLPVLDCFDGITFNKPCKTTERLMFICKNIC